MAKPLASAVGAQAGERSREMKKIYLAGAIEEDPYYFSKFFDIQVELEDKGFRVISPITLPLLSCGAQIKIASAMLEDCDAVCFLADWKDGIVARYVMGEVLAKDIDYFDYEDWKKNNAE